MYRIQCVIIYQTQIRSMNHCLLKQRLPSELIINHDQIYSFNHILGFYSFFLFSCKQRLKLTPMKTFCLIFLGFLNLILCSISEMEEDIKRYDSKVPFMKISFKQGNERKTVKLNFELFFNKTPKTAYNFAKLLEGTHSKDSVKIGYKNNKSIELSRIL
jgi:hypothetical protein